MKNNNFYKCYIDDEIMYGSPLYIEKELQREIIEQIQNIVGNNYENVCNNMRLIADIIELLEEHINDNFIVLKYNPMGAWYIEEDKEEIDYYKEECLI